MLDTIAGIRASCGAHDATVHLLDGTGSPGAHHGPVPSEVATCHSRGLVLGRAVLDRRPVQVDDLSQAEDFPEGREFALQVGYKTTLAVPLLREGVAIGGVVLRRVEAHPFSEQQVALLQTFAAQAVIAIENVRLFKELEARNAELTSPWIGRRRRRRYPRISARGRTCNGLRRHRPSAVRVCGG